MKLIILSVLFQDCPSRQEIQGSLKQVQKLLSAHEASYLQSLRNLKKKINLLQSNAGKQTTRAINSKKKKCLNINFFQLKDVEISSIFFTLYFSNRYLPKTGGTHQWEETWQVTQHGPWSPFSLWDWLWTCGIREQGLSGKPDLERPADCLPRCAPIHLFSGFTVSPLTHPSSQQCLSSSSLWVTNQWHCYLTLWSPYNPVFTLFVTFPSPALTPFRAFCMTSFFNVGIHFIYDP